MLRIEKVSLRALGALLATGLWFTSGNQVRAAEPSGTRDWYASLAEEQTSGARATVAHTKHRLVRRPLPNPFRKPTKVRDDSRLAAPLEARVSKSSSAPSLAQQQPLQPTEQRFESGEAAPPPQLSGDALISALADALAEPATAPVVVAGPAIDHASVTSAIAIEPSGGLSAENILRTSGGDELEPAEIAFDDFEPRPLDLAPLLPISEPLQEPVFEPQVEEPAMELPAPQSQEPDEEACWIEPQPPAIEDESAELQSPEFECSECGGRASDFAQAACPADSPVSPPVPASPPLNEEVGLEAEPVLSDVVLPQATTDGQLDLAQLYGAPPLDAADESLAPDEQVNGYIPVAPVEESAGESPAESTPAWDKESVANNIAEAQAAQEDSCGEIAPGEFSADDLYALAVGLNEVSQPARAYLVAAEEGESREARRSDRAALSKRSTRQPPKLMTIQQTSVDLTPQRVKMGTELSEDDLPPNLASQQFGPYSAAALGGNEYVRHATTHYLWVSPASRHKPLYFEQPNLERYGTHAGGTCLASAAATARFVGHALTLPYQMGAHGPSECIYTLGVYRPGNCTPHFFHIKPLSPKGLLYQGAAVTGLVFLFP